MKLSILIWAVLSVQVGSVMAGTEIPRPLAWERGEPRCLLVLPEKSNPATQLAQRTLNRFLREFYNLELQSVDQPDKPGTYILVGNPDNNPSLARLKNAGLQLTDVGLGDEGFQLITYESAGSRYLVVYGNTARAAKHGCQELVFYHLPATADRGEIDWPLNVVMKPQIAYRGIYMLPCWSQHDSIESWKRVLLFCSELTLNRTWFWLDGFPVAGHKAISHVPGQTSDYDKTPLASEANVQTLIDLVDSEDVKFYVGGGWMTWHHVQAAGNDPIKAKDYYLNYLRAFKAVKGFYFEPPGEGYEADNWAAKCKAMRELIDQIQADRPEFEFAIAVGKFNNHDYLREMAKLDPKRVYWWWCWGDPFSDKAFDLFPSILSWHTVVRMSDMHGTDRPPSESCLRLSGISTSYDPGMGFGNPWNGGSTLGGAKAPRDFHPYTMPYFSHEYRFREHCWNTRISDEEFTRRLGRRLFDADMPAESVEIYLKLADLCFNPQSVDDPVSQRLDAFIKAHAGKGTPRNRDTLQRMTEAVNGLRLTKVKR